MPINPDDMQIPQQLLQPGREIPRRVHRPARTLTRQEAAHIPGGEPLELQAADLCDTILQAHPREESWCASGALIATLAHVARLRTALGLEGSRRRGVRPEIEWIDLKQIALCAAHGQLDDRETVRG